jgi:hypothetical protein
VTEDRQTDRARRPPDEGPGRCEARIFGRYLVGEDPGEPFVDRYGAAADTLLDAPPGPVVRFALRWPRTLPFLDAASAVVRPRGPLRSRLLVMAAVLEASPAYADVFLPRPAGALRQTLDVAITGAVGAVKVVVGLPVLLAARWLG